MLNRFFDWAIAPLYLIQIRLVVDRNYHGINLIRNFSCNMGDTKLFAF